VPATLLPIVMRMRNSEQNDQEQKARKHKSEEKSFHLVTGKKSGLQLLAYNHGRTELSKLVLHLGNRNIPNVRRDPHQAGRRDGCHSVRFLLGRSSV
jgi:hypothetical protein